MIILGIDPGPTLTESHCVINEPYRPLVHCDARELINSVTAASTGIPMVAVIEWIALSAGIYMRAGEERPSRARAGKVLETHSAATTIRDSLHNAGVEVYCVPRRVITWQVGGFSGTSKQDEFVMLTLRRLGLLQTKLCDRADGRQFYRVQTPGLTTTHSRDALMAALFNYRDPRNAQYKYMGGI